MFGKSKTSGFSLIEIMVAMVIIAIMATALVPRISRRRSDMRAQITHELNGLMQFASINALSTGKVQQIFFDMRNQPFVEVRIVTGEKDAQGKVQTAPISGEYIKTRITWPESLEIKNFYIAGKDVVPGGVLKDAWFFVVPDGMAQPVVINAVDDQGGVLSLVLNPFTVQFKRYDEAQRP